MYILNKPTWCRSTSSQEEPPISAPAVDPLKDLPFILQFISRLTARQVRLVRDGVASVLDMRPLTIGSPVLGLLVQSGDWLYVPRAQRSPGGPVQHGPHSRNSYRPGHRELNPTALLGGHFETHHPAREGP